MPSILITILSWVSFWINYDASAARVALGMMCPIEYRLTTDLGLGLETEQRPAFSQREREIWLIRLKKRVQWHGVRSHKKLVHISQLVFDAVVLYSTMWLCCFVGYIFMIAVLSSLSVLLYSAWMVCCENDGWYVVGQRQTHKMYVTFSVVSCMLLKQTGICALSV